MIALLLFWTAPCQAQIPAWELDLPALKSLFADPPPAQAGLPAAPQEARPPLDRLFAHTLVVGASISADLKTASPGRLLARKAGAESSLVSIARAGAPGSEVVAALTASHVKAATVVIGVDLFFWDSTRGCASGLAAVDSFFEMTRAPCAPVVIGNIPALRTNGDRPCREQLNLRIAAACKAAPACFLLNLDRMFQDASSPAGLLSDGRRYTLDDILSDGLHLSAAGSRLVARRIEEARFPPRP